MNYRLVIKYLGHFAMAYSLLMAPSVLWALYFGEQRAMIAFLESMGVGFAFGLLLTLAGSSKNNQMFQREGLALVGLGWIVAAGLGAAPYTLDGVLSPVDAFFESMSGLTTTGATVLTDIEGTDKSILFWRSFTHWLGGMGIIVLFIAVLPYLGAGGKQLFKSESPGPDPRGLSPRIKDTASILWTMYVVLTVVQTILLMVAGMNLYDALCHTFGTLATGGFSTKSASIAAFDSVSVEVIIIVFMGLAGTNFGLFYAMSRGDWTALFKNSEWRLFVGILVVGTALVTLNLIGAQMPAAAGVAPETPAYAFGEALRHAAFTVVAVTTTTGYGTEDFNQWPHFSRMLLVMLMFVGGCAGSTGGGIKVVRVMMLFKMAYWRLESTFRPKTVRRIRINGQVVDDDVQRTVFAFFVLHMIVFGAGCLFMSFLGLPFETAATSVIATLNNIGPGLQYVGAVENYAFIPDAGKVFLSFCMAAGRLELYSFCVLLLPGFWRQG